MIITEERPSRVWHEIMPLLQEHWKEIAHYPDIPLEPDYAVYKNMEDLDCIRLYCARIDGKLVGYSVFFLRYNPHYKSSLQASQDIIYVDPAYRGGVGRHLIKECDERLKKEGVQVVYQHVKAKHNFGSMLERMGYELQDLIYSKRLDKEN